MAAENQNFTKYLEDTFVIQFTITDSDTELDDYKAFWSCKLDKPDPLLSDTQYLAIVKTTTGDFSASGSIGYESSNIFNVYISQSDFISKNTVGGTANIGTDLVTGSYIHELTLEPASGDESVVVARGTLTLKEALFPGQFRDDN